MHPEPVKTEGMPIAIGPYSQVVRLGDLLFVSGQGGLDPATGEPPPGGFPAEGRQALRNLARALEAAGSGLGEVAKVTVYLTNVENFPTLNELFAEFFPENPPARATPIVQLPRGLLISIEAVAAAP
jgi:2-iminobutanoate/2-iminopropanoate deaminase